jgi:delta11-fatty-acid desaturase
MQKPTVVDSKFRQDKLKPGTFVNITKTTLTLDNYKDKKIITKILGRYYDLTDFKHPAGPIAIACAEGRDATELFMSHHLFTKKDVKDILS